MPFLARSPESFLGQSVGSGQCVAFVEACAGCPPTSHWVRGRAVRNDPTIPYGSAIATFSPEGLYTNSTDGSSHAAIYLGQDAKGLRVLDQWSGQPVHARTIRFPGPSAPPPAPANSANCFFLIELASPPPSPVK